MKPHSAFLALSVLCLGNAAAPRRAAAQIPAPTEQVEPAQGPAPVEGARPVDAPATPVHAAPPTPVHDPPTPPVPIPAPAATPAPAQATGPTPAELAEKARRSPRLRDAHQDRILLVPTAETNPAGSFYATSYEIVLLQIGYSISDSTQISLSAVPPLNPDIVIPGDLSIKTVVLREPRVSVALIASASGVVGYEEFSGFLGRAGGAVSLCADPGACRLGFSVGTSVALAGPASVWFSGVGLSWRVARILSLLAEVDTALPLGEPVGEANGVLGGVGLRLSGRAWGVDLALLRGAKARSAPTEVLPFIAVTYRYVP